MPQSTRNLGLLPTKVCAQWLCADTVGRLVIDHYSLEHFLRARLKHPVVTRIHLPDHLPASTPICAQSSSNTGNWRFICCAAPEFVLICNSFCVSFSAMVRMSSALVAFTLTVTLARSQHLHERGPEAVSKRAIRHHLDNWWVVGANPRHPDSRASQSKALASHSSSLASQNSFLHASLFLRCIPPQNPAA